MLDSAKRRSVSLGYRIARLWRLNGCLLDGWLTDLSMSVGQIPYIMSTIEKEGQTQDELSTEIRVDRAATARTLKSMEKSGLIEREQNPKNRRQKLVYPTTKGKARYDKLIPLLDHHNEVMFRGFSDDERKTAIALMDRVIANVQCELDGENR